MNKKEYQKEYQKIYFQKNKNSLKFYSNSYKKHKAGKKKLLNELINIFNRTSYNTIHQPMIRLYNKNSKLYEYRNNLSLIFKDY